MNRPITSTETESVKKKKKKLPKTEVQDQMASQTNSVKHLEVRVNINPSETNYKKLQRKEHFQTHSMRPLHLDTKTRQK